MFSCTNIIIALRFFINLKHINQMEAELINQIKAQVAAISSDIDKVDNKAARARVRKATLRLEKLGKVYRKESIG